MSKIPESIRRIAWFELAVWTCGLIYLVVIDPNADKHFSICPLKNVGFEFCPGCGLGESVSHLLHLQIGPSFHSHPLGLFALIVILHRMFVLSKPLVSIINHQPAKG